MKSIGSKKIRKVEEAKELLGTLVKIILVGENEDEMRAAIGKAFFECERIGKLYSRYCEDSEVSRLNRSIGSWLQVDPEFYGLIVWSSKFKHETRGAFDITVKNVKQIGTEMGVIELADNMMVRINSEIDLGGMGKGYAIDQMLKELSGFQDVFINAGGELYGRGLCESGNPWRTFFEHPTKADELIGSVFMEDFALSCSNQRKRKWRESHCLVNPRTLQPADDMLSVYVQSASAAMSDAYSTALFVMGYEVAKKHLAKLPVEAMLISKEGKIFKSPDFKGELFLSA